MPKVPLNPPAEVVLARKIGKRLSQIRRARGLSRQDFAVLLSLPPDRIAEYEKGTRLMRTLTLSNVAQILGITSAVLIDDQPPKETTLDPAALSVAQRLSNLPQHERQLLLQLFGPLLSGFELVLSMQAKATKRAIQK